MVGVLAPVPAGGPAVGQRPPAVAVEVVVVVAGDGRAEARGDGRAGLGDGVHPDGEGLGVVLFVEGLLVGGWIEVAFSFV